MVESVLAPCTLHEIERRVRARSYGRIRRLHVALRDGRVVLRGRSETYYAKQLAQQGARELVPEGRIYNEIEVA